MPEFPIAANDRRSGPFVAGAGQTVFPYDFPLFDAADIAVYEQSSGATIATKLAGSAFAVTGIGEEVGGTIVLATAAVAGTIYSIAGARSSRRTSDFTDAGELRAATLNRELDLLTQTAQEQSATIGRSLRLAETDAASDTVLPVASARAGKVLGFDALGNPIATTAGALALGTGDVTGDKIAAGAVDLSKLAADVLAALGGGTATIVAGEALADRDLIYQDVFNQRGAGADRWYKIDADAVSPVRIGPRIGIALAAIASGSSGSAQVRSGSVSGFSGLTAGAPVFASAAAGAITQTAPAIPSTGTQNASRRIGYAASATEVDFDPDDDTVFTARNSAVAVDGTITVQHWADVGAREREQAAYLVQAMAFVATAARATGTGADGTGWTNYGARARVAAAQVSVSGNQVRVTLAARASGATFANVFIGHGAASGNLWDFETTPTRVTFGGGNSAVVGGNASLQSDSIAFALDETKPLVVAMDVGSHNVWALAVGSAPTGWNGWSKAGGSGEAGTTAPTGYTNDSIVGLASVEVLAAARDEPLTIGGSVANSTATDRVNVRYDDGLGADADTRTTFVNRTGATRDLAVEVML